MYAVIEAQLKAHRGFGCRSIMLAAMLEPYPDGSRMSESRWSIHVMLERYR